MSKRNEDPRWDLLPHNPEAFFGLKGEFGRKDLKRRYNALIRRYKPERAPAEFQRIRAAYEMLENQLRYGQQMRQPAESIPQYSWHIPEEMRPSQSEVPDRRSDRAAGRGRPLAPTEPARGRRPARRPLYERLNEQEPETLYRELSGRENKTPYDYFALALLSDVAVPKDRLRFVKWLLAGLKAYPHERGLFSLLYSYFRSPLPIRTLPQLLTAISKVVREDRFFFLTEPLWDRLLREAPFETFRQTLAQCEHNLRDHRIDGRLTFYVHILKAALWKADAAWTDEAFAFVEDNYRILPPHMEYDVEILYCLRDYIRQRDEFLNGHPLRREMDHVLRAYSCAGETVADRRFLECQLRLEADGDELLRAFPVADGESYDAFFVAWNWVSGEIAERVGEEPNADDPRIRWRQVGSLLETIEIKTDKSMAGSLWTACAWLYLLSRIAVYPLVGLAVFVPLVILFGDENTPTFLVSLALAGAAAWLAGKPLIARLIEPCYSTFCRRMAGRCYNRLWRRELLGFLRRTHLPFFGLTAMIEQMKENRFTCRSWILYYSQKDFGLAVFSNAQRFVA